MMPLENEDGAVSESEVKVGLNGTNGYAIPLFGFPNIPLPSAIGGFAEQGVASAQQGCEKIKVASAEMAEALCETYSSNAKGATDYAAKLIEMSNANTVSAIDFFAQALGSKSVPDVFTLSVAQARKTFDTASAQNKELWGLGEKLAKEAGEPIKKYFAKVLHPPS